MVASSVLFEIFFFLSSLFFFLYVGWLAFCFFGGDAFFGFHLLFDSEMFYIIKQFFPFQQLSLILHYSVITRTDSLSAPQEICQSEVVSTLNVYVFKLIFNRSPW